MDVLFPLTGWSALILVLEGMIWFLFRRKFMEICVPQQERDTTFFHFFTVWRLRLFALLHTAVLLVCVIVAHLLLWP